MIHLNLKFVLEMKDDELQMMTNGFYSDQTEEVQYDTNHDSDYIYCLYAILFY